MARDHECGEQQKKLRALVERASTDDEVLAFQDQFRIFLEARTEHRNYAYEYIRSGTITIHANPSVLSYDDSDSKDASPIELFIGSTIQDLDRYRSEVQQAVCRERISARSQWACISP